MLKYLVLAFILLLAISATQRERIYNDTYFLREPFYKRSAASQVEEIARILEAEVAQGGDLPTRLTFPEFLQAKFPDPEKTVDPWGTPYYIQNELYAARVGSAGPDRQVGTEDDIRSRLVQGRLPGAAEGADTSHAGQPR